MLVQIPKLAKCSDRTNLAKSHERGGPEDWLTGSILSSHGLIGLTFDFFVDWNRGALTNQLWIKRITDLPIERHTEVNLHEITQSALALGDNLHGLHTFATEFNFEPRYMIFRENVDWKNASEHILKLKLGDGIFEQSHACSLQSVMKQIRDYSGGPVKVGAKGLIYGTSALECYLSQTDAAWPGDCDMVLWNPNGKNVEAILEFKKHTLDTAIGDQNLGNYLRTDFRKWQRLAMLRDRLGSNTKLFCIYYPTGPNPPHGQIKVESIIGESNNLTSCGSALISIDDKRSDIGTAILQCLMQNHE